MNAGDVMIRVEDVRLSYKVREGWFRWSGHTPLKGVSFDVRRGETVGVIGRNGAGKSSLLRLMAGLYKPDGGTIVNHGKRVSLLLLRANFVPQLTGRQNAMMSGLLMGMSRKEIAGRIDEIQAFSGLGKFMDYPMSTYSTGMRTRLGFSVAIQTNADVLLVDEVLGVGDKDFHEKSTKAMKNLVNSDKTVVLVSHALPVVSELCNRVVWLENGVVRECGETKTVLRNYENG